MRVQTIQYDRLRATESGGRWRLPVAGALTVGENEGFAHWGGVIKLIMADGKLRLEINQTSAEKAGLKISAKLLSLARVIRN
jgi:uncharacterized protein DUF4154